MIARKTAPKSPKQIAASRNLIIGVLLQIPAAIGVLILYLLAPSTLVFFDALRAFSVILFLILLLVLGKKVQKENGEKYNFGMGRLINLIQFFSHVLSLCIALFTIKDAALEFSALPVVSDSLWVFVLIKVYGLTTDIVFLCSMNAARRGTSVARNALFNVILDSVILVGTATIMFLKEQDFAALLLPIVALVGAAFYAVTATCQVVALTNELSDRALPKEEQDKIHDLLIENAAHIKKIVDVRCRKEEGAAIVEIGLEYKEGTTLEDVDSLYVELKKSLEEILPACTLRLYVAGK